MHGIIFIVIHGLSMFYQSKQEACYQAFAPKPQVMDDMSGPTYVYEINFDSGTVRSVNCPRYRIQELP